MNKIYAVYDIVAAMIVGQLHLYRADAPAIRMFTDVATAKEPNMINAHLQDYNLLCLGTIADNTDDALFPVEIIPQMSIVLEGKTLKTLIDQENENNAG